MSERIWTRNPDAREQERNTQNGRQEAETEQEETKGGTPQCPECDGHVATDNEHGETVCNDRGFVVTADPVDRGPGWRVFNAREKDEKPRVSAPTTDTMHGKGPSTNIDQRDRDAYGSSLDARQRQKMQWSRKRNERFRTCDFKERDFKQALGEIDRMVSVPGLPENVRETASVIYRRVLDDDLLLGRSIESVATSCTCAAARMAGVPRSFNEIVEASRVEKSEIAHTYHYIAHEPSLEVKLVDPEQCVPRFASELGLSDESKIRACQLPKNAKEKGVHSGKSPVGLAAAAIYVTALLTNEKTMQAAVSDVADISKVATRNRYHELLEAKENLGLV